MNLVSRSFSRIFYPSYFVENIVCAIHNNFLTFLLFLLPPAENKSDEVEFECKSKSGGAEKDSPPDGEEELSDEPTTRGITITPSEEIKDKIKYKVKTTDEGIRVKLEYKQEIETETEETETKTKFELIFGSLVEYIKGPGGSESEAFDWDQDEIIQTIPLTGWNDIPAVASDAGGILSFFTASTDAMEGPGSAAFNFTVSRADIDEHITANSMKIDMKIIDFPWQRTDSYVALMSTLESKKKVKVEYDDRAIVSETGKSKKAKDVIVSFGEDIDSTLGFAAYGSYTWEEEAVANSMMTSDAGMNNNGTIVMARQGAGAEDANIVVVEAVTNKTIEVIATSPSVEEEEGTQTIAYSFVGSGAHSASEIYWDPSTGIEYESSAFSVSFMGVAGSLVAALVFVVL